MAVSQKLIWKEFYVPASTFLYGLQKEHDSSWTHFSDYSKRPNLLSAQLFRDCDGGEANLQKQTQSLSSMEVSSATLLRGPRWHGVHELLGFPPFISIFPLRSLTGSCSIKYLPNSTLFSSTFSATLAEKVLYLPYSLFQVLSSLPPFTVDFLRERSPQGLRTFVFLHSLPYMILPSPLFSSYPLKLIGNLLITRWSIGFFSAFLLTASHPYYHGMVLTRNPPTLPPLKFFLPLDSITHVLTFWPFLLRLCWPHFFYCPLKCGDFSVLSSPLIFLCRAYPIPQLQPPPLCPWLPSMYFSSKLCINSSPSNGIFVISQTKISKIDLIFPTQPPHLPVTT